MNAERARQTMVDSQVRPSDVTDPGLVRAMRRLPREAFAPGVDVAVAYGDLEVEIAPRRMLLRPRHMSKLIQALAPKSGESALEIAAGTGYGAATLAAMGLNAIALEADADLCRAARAALETAGLGAVKVVSTDIREGWAADGPYDVIVLNGACEGDPPAAWIEQLAEGGRLGAIVRNGPAGAARIYAKARGVTSFTIAFDAAPPVAPGLEAPRGFAF